MTAKRLLFLSLLFPALLSAQRTVITGKISHPTAKTVVLQYYTDPFSEKKVEQEVSLDKDGNFKVVAQLAHPMEASVVHLPEETHLYIVPGDSLYMTLDTKQFDETVKYAGKGAADNNFMAAYFLKFEDKTMDQRKAEVMRLIKSTPDSYLALEDSMEQIERNYLNENGKELSPEFARFMSDKIAYFHTHNKFIYPGLKRYYTGKEIEVPANYYDFIKKVRVKNDSALNNSYYVDFLSDFTEYETARLIRDSKLATTNYDLKAYQVANTVFDGQIRDVALTQFMLDALEESSFQQADSVYTYFKNDVQDTALQALVRPKYEKEKNLSPGHMAPEFVLRDIDGKTVSLKDFRGKVVYLDFWASWCGPCMHEMPYTKKLHEAFQGKDVVFLYISVDDNEKDWKKAIKDKEIEGIHLLSASFDGSAAKLYNVHAIPCYFIIGRDGKIINSNATRPSDDKTVAALNAALQE